MSDAELAVRKRALPPWMDNSADATKRRKGSKRKEKDTPETAKATVDAETLATAVSEEESLSRSMSLPSYGGFSERKNSKMYSLYFSSQEEQDDVLIPTNDIPVPLSTPSLANQPWLSQRSSQHSASSSPLDAYYYDYSHSNPSQDKEVPPLVNACFSSSSSSSSSSFFSTNAPSSIRISSAIIQNSEIQTQPTSVFKVEMHATADVIPASLTCHEEMQETQEYDETLSIPSSVAPTIPVSQASEKESEKEGVRAERAWSGGISKQEQAPVLSVTMKEMEEEEEETAIQTMALPTLSLELEDEEGEEDAEEIVEREQEFGSPVPFLSMTLIHSPPHSCSEGASSQLLLPQSEQTTTSSSSSSSSSAASSSSASASSSSSSSSSSASSSSSSSASSSSFSSAASRSSKRVNHVCQRHRLEQQVLHAQMNTFHLLSSSTALTSVLTAQHCVPTSPPASQSLSATSLTPTPTPSPRKGKPALNAPSGSWEEHYLQRPMAGHSLPSQCSCCSGDESSTSASSSSSTSSPSKASSSSSSSIARSRSPGSSFYELFEDEETQAHTHVLMPPYSSSSSSSSAVVSNALEATSSHLPLCPCDGWSSSSDDTNSDEEEDAAPSPAREAGNWHSCREKAKGKKRWSLCSDHPDRVPRALKRRRDFSSYNFEPSTSVLSVIQLPPPGTLKKFNYHACCHSSKKGLPQENVNKFLTDILVQVERAHAAAGEEWHALGMHKAIAALRNYPKRVTSGAEAKTLKGVGTTGGDRVAKKIDEILATGKLTQLQVREEQDRVIETFGKIWGAGPRTAMRWYSKGYMSLDSLRAHPEELTEHQKLGLKYYDEFNERIPRWEMDEHKRIVETACKELDPALSITLTGSYRRGKPDSGDIDVVITHSGMREPVGILPLIVNRLKNTGYLTDDLGLSDPEVQRDWTHHFDLYMGACKLEGRSHRRIDLLIIPVDNFAATLMYFTGSEYFNRSMRHRAKRIGFYLCNHAIARANARGKRIEGTVIPVRTEEEIFKILGLEYRPPEERDW